MWGYGHSKCNAVKRLFLNIHHRLYYIIYPISCNLRPNIMHPHHLHPLQPHPPQSHPSSPNPPLHPDMAAFEPSHNSLEREHFLCQPHPLNMGQLPAQMIKVGQGSHMSYFHLENQQGQSIQVDCHKKQPELNHEFKTGYYMSDYNKAILFIRRGRLNQQQMGWLKAYRQARIQHYLRKKATRRHRRKPMYLSRKRSADSRIRYLGRFITECQAKQLLGRPSGAEHTFQELRAMMRQYRIST